MKSHSPRDIAFLEVFAGKLGKAREAKKKAGELSYAQFAEKLGVTRAGLHKYLHGKNMPSLDVLERARALGVEVQYGELNVNLIKKRARKSNASAEAQMLLPLVLESLSQKDIAVELGPRKPNSIEVSLTIHFSPKSRTSN